MTPSVLGRAWLACVLLAASLSAGCVDESPIAPTEAGEGTGELANSNVSLPVSRYEGAETRSFSGTLGSRVGPIGFDASGGFEADFGWPSNYTLLVVNVSKPVVFYSLRVYAESVEKPLLDWPVTDWEQHVLEIYGAPGPYRVEIEAGWAEPLPLAWSAAVTQTHFQPPPPEASDSASGSDARD